MSFKKELLQHILQYLKTQAVELKTEINSIQVEMSQETKSSAGDKFETGREMMQQEISRLDGRLASLHHQQKTIREMMNTTTAIDVDFGTLAKSDRGFFLFGISLGKINFQENTIMAVSLNSPIGNAFRNTKTNEAIRFMNNTYNILSIS